MQTCHPVLRSDPAQDAVLTVAPGQVYLFGVTVII